MTTAATNDQVPKLGQQPHHLNDNGQDLTEGALGITNTRDRGGTMIRGARDTKRLESNSHHYHLHTATRTTGHETRLTRLVWQTPYEKSGAAGAPYENQKD